MRERHALGTDLGASHIKSGLVSELGKVRFKKTYPTPVALGPAKIVATLQELASDLIILSRRHGIEVWGIGIGTPGTVEFKSGRVLGASPNIPGWTKVNLKKAFQKFKLPVCAANDANLMALAELRLGAARGHKNVVCFTVGTGIGGGIIIEGRLYQGTHHEAGELGHTSINFSGKSCRCGRTGCLEAYASVPAMLNTAQALISESGNRSLLGKYKSSLTLTQLFGALRLGDRIARQVINLEIEYLSSGLANLVNLLNPELLVAGGGLVEVSTSFLRKLEIRIKQKAFASATRNLRVSKAKLGNDAGFIGAALFCLESTKSK